MKGGSVKKRNPSRPRPNGKAGREAAKSAKVGKMAHFLVHLCTIWGEKCTKGAPKVYHLGKAPLKKCTIWGMEMVHFWDYHDFVSGIYYRQAMPVQYIDCCGLA